MRRQVLGDRHRGTLASIGNLVDLLREQGRLEDASAILGNTPSVAAEVLGELHLSTLVLKAKAAQLTQRLGGGAKSLGAVVASMEAVVGEAHPKTLKYAAALREMQDDTSQA